MRREVTGLAVFALAISAMVPLAASRPAAASAVAGITSFDEAIPTNLYVATAGDDVSTNPCTAIDAPCRTVTGAVTRAQTAIGSGSIDVTVNIATGTYNENVDIGSVTSGHRLNLVGAAASTTTVHGLGTASVVKVTSGTVDISGLSITGGHALSGGGIYNNTGTLTVSDAAVSGNTAAGLSTAGGGGIYNNAGTVTVSDSTVSDNEAATGYAGGIFNNSGTLIVSDSTMSDNAGWYVGGIHNLGTLNMSGTSVSDNLSTKNFGGGISNSGTMTVTNSTLSGNSATNSNLGKGGAIYNKGLATVTNTTLSGNSAYQGGAIWTRSKLLTVSHSTLSGNTHTYSLAGQVRPGGGIFADSSPFVIMSNSILSGSSCNQKYAAVDGGHNVSDDSSCFTAIGPTSIHDSTTIGLAPLAANGSTGPKTMAIDSASSAHHLVPTCTGTDARGLARPGFSAPANCDAGAYELQGSAPTVTTDPQSQTLAIGSDATFTAAASGAPTPTVTWQVDTGSTWTDLSGVTATTLTVTDVTHAMSGNRYRAVFTNGAGPDATTAAATLTVPVGALDHLVLSPSSATVAAGGSQAFTAAGFDSFGNGLGDVTATTVFTGSAGLECTAGSCTSSVAGTYTVTGTDAAATGTASLTVTAMPEVDLPTVPGPPIGAPTTPALPDPEAGGGSSNPPGAALPSGEVVSLRDGRLSTMPRAAPPGVEVVAGTVTPTGGGAWSVSATGEVFTTGDARQLGGTSGRGLNAPIVGVASTPSGGGYWLVGRDGGVFSFGDAEFFGSTGDMRLNQPAVGLRSTPTGHGYWLFAGDGGVFTFGDARFLGSTGAMSLQAPIIAMTPASSEASGYWLLGADGGVFTFGSARFFGSTGGNQPVGSIVAMVPTPTGRGYWLIGTDRQVHEFGDA